MATPKDNVQGRPSQKDTSNSTDRGNSTDKGADDKSAKAQDNQADTTQTASSVSANSKPEKSDKSSNEDDVKASDVRASDDKASDSKDSDQPVSAIDSQDQQALQQALVTLDQQNLPPPPPVAQTSIPADGESDDMAVDTAAPAAIKPQADIKAAGNGKPEAKPGIKADARTPAKTPVNPALSAETPELADDSSEDTGDTEIAESATQVAPSPAKTAAPTRTPTSADIQTPPAASDRSAAVQNSGAKNTDVPDTAQAPKDVDPKDGAPKDVAAKTDTTDPVPAGKSAGIKNTPSKTRLAQAGTPDKADAANSDATKSDTSKTAAPPIDVPNVASAPKAAPHPAQQAIFAINSIAAPQATQSSPIASATANAHVQVSAEAAPDLPLLVVAIAGKSQAGAKQFDIRLDPPELGRVEVRLSIDATGKASAHLSADQPQTLSLLQKDAPVLARALRDAGLDVSQDGLNFSLRQQTENQNGNAGNNGRRGSSRAFPVTASISTDTTAGSAAYRVAANGRLDIRI